MNKNIIKYINLVLISYVRRVMIKEKMRKSYWFKIFLEY
jgi:hypothetical protein